MLHSPPLYYFPTAPLRATNADLMAHTLGARGTQGNNKDTKRQKDKKKRERDGQRLKYEISAIALATVPVC